MKTISLPPESAEYINAERGVQESDDMVDALAAKQRRMSSPDFVDEEDAQHTARIQRGEMPRGPRKSLTEKREEVANELADAKEVQRVRRGIRDAIKAREEQRVREAMLPVVEPSERKISEYLLGIYSELRKTEQVEGKLAGRGFGHWGMPRRLDTSRIFPETAHRTSDIAQLLRQAASLGYIKLPEELR
ncbi:hypothetical protein ACNJX9_25350 [Bradyrhizobium sp. DASA03076]|uniref:hypothetical protein n=1 Tax=Bradyrhizobium sp. BLXBL-03 TaxID=3395916 RepID=UPI003F6F2135